MTKLLLIGSGGREHALARALSLSPLLEQLWISPGNPGTALLGENLDIPVDHIDALLAFATSNNVDLTIVGPELPLALGIVDRFVSAGLAIIGPNQYASQLESSKAWAKDLMQEAGIPTADFHVFEDYELAQCYLTSAIYPLVIKADGLASGKGVSVCLTQQEALLALADIMQKKRFKSAGSRVVIESFLQGEEISLLAFCDGQTILPMASAQDHKRLLDYDQGPNTGGMGAYSPSFLLNSALLQRIQDCIFSPLLKAFQSRSIVYKGVVYAGLMIHPNGDPFVVEFNVRFGDPETQVVLPRLKTDLLSVFLAILQQRLDQLVLEWSEDVAVCVVAASEHYPESGQSGGLILGISNAVDDPSLIHAGTRLEGHHVHLDGGRVLATLGVAPTLPLAIDAAYTRMAAISFPGMQYRRDIAARALPRIKGHFYDDLL